MTDKRKDNSIDLPEDIDIIAQRSTDGGKTWSEPVTVAKG
ncbi:MAG: exo-alpha-sialidase [Saprospiraceae bacterium]|nr:exo-alpha-sialidase [Candidatus Parvibacillus calidus]